MLELKYFSGSKWGRCHFGNQERRKDNANIIAHQKAQNLCKCIDFAKRVAKTEKDAKFLHWSNSNDPLATKNPGDNCFIFKSCADGHQEKNKDPGTTFRLCPSNNNKGDND